MRDGREAVILVVEDDEHVRELFEVALRAPGRRLIPVRSASEALAAARGDDIDVP